MSFKSKLAAAAVVASTTMAFTPAQAQDILVGGGSVTGVYYQVALHFCNVINKNAEAYNCVGRPALGSSFNINAVKRGLLDFGVAQSDRNFDAYNGEGEWEGTPIEDLRSVMSIHPETVLLVAREDANISSVDDLAGKSVNIGNPGSGQRGNAEDVLRLNGLSADDLDAQGLQQHEASRALIDGKIDAFFYTVGNPAAAIEEPANSIDINLVDVNSDGIQEFVKERPYYVMTTIPGGTYMGEPDDTETYAVKATMVTSTAASEEMVYDAVKTLFENFEQFQSGHAAFKNLEPAEMLQGLTAPLHPGAAKYYKERGWM